MTTTTETKTRTITLTGRPPVKIADADWPVVADAKNATWDGQYEFQAFRKWADSIRVRQHADGRRLVYGIASHSTAHQGEQDYRYSGGYIVEVGGDVCATITQIAEELIARGAPDSMRETAAECIADLPAEAI